MSSGKSTVCTSKLGWQVFIDVGRVWEDALSLDSEDILTGRGDGGVEAPRRKSGQELSFVHARARANTLKLLSIESPDAYAPSILYKLSIVLSWSRKGVGLDC